MEKTEKNAMWKELKMKWAVLKRGSSSNDEQKKAAKDRINEIQEALGLDKTDFDKPYEPKGGSTTASTGDNKIGTESIQKALVQILNRARENGEEIAEIKKVVERIDASIQMLIAPKAGGA